MKIPVTFRIDKKRSDFRQVTAVFLSRETHPTNSEHDRTCYAHIGQHGECSLDWVRCNTRPAKPEEYASLLRELTGIYNTDGNTLDVKPTMRSMRVES